MVVGVTSGVFRVFDEVKVSTHDGVDVVRDSKNCFDVFYPFKMDICARGEV